MGIRRLKERRSQKDVLQWKCTEFGQICKRAAWSINKTLRVTKKSLNFSDFLTF